jgi:hypothetical protein
VSNIFQRFFGTGKLVVDQVNKASPIGTDRTTSRFVRFLIFCAILVGAAVLTLIVVFSAWRWRLGQSINSRIAAIKAAGLPVNWEDLAQWPVSVPDDENAAYIYTNAIAHLNEKSLRTISGISDILQFHQPVSAEMHLQFELPVRTNIVALSIISQVTNASESRYPIDYLDGPSAKLPHLAGLKSLAELLAFDAILNVEASNATAGLDDVNSQLNLSQSLDNEPMMISQLVSAGILVRSCQTLEEVFAHTPLPEEQLSQLESRFTATEATNRFLTGLIGERALYNELIRLAQDDPQKMVEIANETSSGDDDQTELPRNPGAGWRLIGFFDRDRNFFLDAMATNLFFIQQGPPGSLAVSDLDDGFGVEARKELYIFSSMFLPVESGIAKRDANTRAELRDTITAIAVERWRLRNHSALPNALEDLVPAFLPAVPADPFDGKPLRYKKLKKGYSIYSGGPNLRDDGGRGMPRPSGKFNPDWKNYDIVFTVERS